MAKKTSAQKGYRKTTKKKPFLTKKEIIALVIIVLLVILGFIVIQNLPDGFIGADEIQPGDVVSYASSDNRTRFLKLADANELEGYTRVNSAEGVSPLPSYSYTPDDESSPVKTVILTGSNVEASLLSDRMLASAASYGVNSSATGKMAVTVQGHDAYVFGITESYYNEENVTEETAEEPAEEAVEEPAEETAEEPAPNTFMQYITLYADYDGEHSVALHVYLSVEDESAFIPEDQILDYVMPFTESFTILEKEAK